MAVIQYIMRCFNTVNPIGWVYWASLGAPDPDALQSGYNPAQLNLPATVDYSVTLPTSEAGNFTPSGIAGGDLGNSYPDPTVIKIQGKPISGTSPTNGQVLEWNGTAWTPTAAGSGFTAGGDLEGSSTDQTVIKLQGKTLSTDIGDPAVDEAIVWNGTAYDTIPIAPIFNVKSYGAKGDGTSHYCNVVLTGDASDVVDSQISIKWWFVS